MSARIEMSAPDEPVLMRVCCGRQPVVPAFQREFCRRMQELAERWRDVPVGDWFEMAVCATDVFDAMEDALWTYVDDGWDRLSTNDDAWSDDAPDVHAPRAAPHATVRTRCAAIRAGAVAQSMLGIQAPYEDARLDDFRGVLRDLVLGHTLPATRTAVD